VTREGHSGAGSTETHRVSRSALRVDGDDGVANGRGPSPRTRRASTVRPVREYCSASLRGSEPVPAGRRYLLVSPCRDEAAYIRRTLDSVARQSIPPTSWIVVDDGSTDETPAILAEYAARLPYLTVVRRDDRGRRSVGPGVVEAFYAGLEGVDLGRFDYLCKLDMDLDLPPRYFEGLMKRMENEPRLGTTSGKPWFVHPASGELVPEVCGD